MPKNLQLLGRVWWLKAQHNGRIVRRNLGTGDVNEAKRLRDQIVHRLKNPPAPRGIEEEALALRKYPTEDRNMVAWQRAEELSDFDEVLSDEGFRFLEIATGSGTPFTPELIDGWIRARRYGPKISTTHRNRLKELQEWLARQGLPPLIERVTSKLAGTYKIERERQGVHPVTLDNRLWSFRSFYNHCISHGLIDLPANPWSGKTPVKKPVLKHEKERSLTDEELHRLLHEVRDEPEMLDLITIALSTGSRIEAIYSLKCKHVNLDEMTVMFTGAGSKTDAGTRTLPIAKALRPFWKRLCEGLTPDQYVVEPHHGKDLPPGRRSNAASKRFYTRRINAGVNDHVEGKRRARTNFHSLRRTSIVWLEKSEIKTQIIERYVGHKPTSYSLSEYSSAEEAGTDILKVAAETLYKRLKSIGLIS